MFPGHLGYHSMIAADTTFNILYFFSKVQTLKQDKLQGEVESFILNKI